MDEDCEIRIFQVLTGCETAPLAQMSSRHAIPRSTLRHRKKGGTTARKARESSQNHSCENENNLIEWTLNEQTAGRVLTKKDAVLCSASS